MNRTPSDKSSSSETKEIENVEETLPSETENKLLNEVDPTIVEGELVATLEDEAETLDCSLNMNEKPSKGGDTIIDILTEKHLDSIIEHRQKSFPVYFMGVNKSEPVGAVLDYGEGSRNDFVRLVFLITTSMLAYTTAFVFMCMKIEGLKNFMHSMPGLILLGVCTVGLMIISYAFACSDCTREVPINWIAVVLATIFYSVILGFVCSRYATYIVLCAAGTTLLISAVCLGLAFTGIDFTKFIMIVIIAGLALGASMLFLLILHLMGIDISLARKIILVLSTVVSAIMLIIEFQMVLGGKSVELGEDDYCYAAYMIYTSMVDIFIQLLYTFAFDDAD